MDTAFLTWCQALQLAALGPCLFVIFFLCVIARNPGKILVPVLYFVSLSCNFILPLSDVFGFADSGLHAILLAGKSTTAALSFLLIIEFIIGTIPPFIYWTVLAIPLMGGSSIDYVSLLVKGEICIHDNLCATPTVFRQLYEIFGSSLIFLLTIVLYPRLSKGQPEEGSQDKNKYAIIISLIVLNLMIVAIKLLYISGHVAPERAEVAATVVRMGFIYLVLTFVFRVFDGQLEIAYERVPTITHIEPSERDLALADNIRRILTEEKVYRTMELSRADFARRIAVTENNLSRVINMCFKQSFTALINSCRIEEAKKRLTNETTAVTAIAFEVGFNSIPSFNRVFKHATGLSPTEYRSSQQQLTDSQGLA